jgi:hypothetical protein
MNDSLSTADRQLLLEREIAEEEIRAQLELLRDPPAAVRLDRPAVIGDGIEQPSPNDKADALDAWERIAQGGQITKFVPASGAASRMFGELAAESNVARGNGTIERFVSRLPEFPFFRELMAELNPEVDESTPDVGEVEWERVIRALLSSDGLGYGSRPKALIPFHRYHDGVRTAFEEQLHEAAGYVADRSGQCRVHFTVAPETTGEFEEHLATVGPGIERARDCRLDVSFSLQHPSTDTIAIDTEGNLFRSADGRIVFRPGGHGALLRNLEELDARFVVIKNIDNILPDQRMELVVEWKKVLIGLAVELTEIAQSFVRACRDAAADELLDQAVAFAQTRFRRMAPERLDVEEKRRFVVAALDRPIRVCGVVRNQGEPGGAPFWVHDRNGNVTLQIVESAQVLMDDPGQAEIWSSSTHFNPVDVVCSLRDWKGNRFDLRQFVDRDAVVIATKSHEGRTLQALERPGLWNGAMAGWNTLCVEVPGETFAPVKTLFDLLRPEHQGTSE